MSTPEQIQKFGPSGGQWTIPNRVRCAILGHVIPPCATAHGSNTVSYLCARCNAFAYFYDREAKRGFRSFEDWYDEIGQHRASLAALTKGTP